ncbi:MAG: 4-hydroxy-tetrahydrodipicolinate synthase [Planctomycetota bacterium]|nr:4-hydroxy-tetrahydrodipicolinate synthase [Planctomycetota bacterium]
MTNSFHGSFPAVPTPMRAGAVDLDGLALLIEAHATRATTGVVVCGTTGEGSTLSDAERAAVLIRTLDVAAGRLQVIAGVGTNVTRDTVRRAREAQQLGADGLLVVTPYYNKPSARGLLAHFGAVAEASDLPIVLYNVPGRTACDLGPELVGELVERHANVVAIKEASDRLERVRALAAIEGLSVLCGEDAFLADFLRYGAVGSINVVGNIAPDAVAELVQVAGPSGDPDRANALHRRLAPLCRALFLESNPVPLKRALANLGWCTDEVRLPLAPLEDASRRALEEALARAGDLLMRPAPEPEIA